MRRLNRIEPDAASTIALLLGTALTLVGAIDVLLLWWPFRLGSVEWEFATVGATFNALPLLTIGIGILAITAVVRDSKWLRRALMTLSLLLCLALIGIAILYVLTLPVAWRGSPPAARTALIRLMVKTTLYSGIYVVMFGALAGLFWRFSGSTVRIPAPLHPQ